MPLWGNSDVSASAPKEKQLFINSQNAGQHANGSTLYHNTTPSATTNGMIVGLYGVTKTMIQAAQANHATNLSQPGWVLVRQGTGPVMSLAASPGGLSYNNTDVLTISGNGCANATFHPVTNATGGILSFTTNSAGFGFPNTAYVTQTWANSTGGATGGSGATVTLTLGGRAGRINRETLVSMKSMQSASNTNLFPNV
jgi:hypothetical protein